MTSGPAERLRDGRVIAAVLRARRQRAGRLLALHLRDAGEDRPARVAVIASRRVGTAVRRNRAKRLLREAARHTSWPRGTDAVLVARTACADSHLVPVRRELEQLKETLGSAQEAAR